MKLYIKNIVILILLIIILTLLYIIKRNISQFDTFTNNEDDTEIHFITLWEENNKNASERLENAINNYKEPYIRIIKQIKIKKNNIKQLFKNVNSGGKHYNHDINVFIIEVPNIYKIHKTHDYPKGENVNDIMYNLKKTSRGDYQNYKVAHGSFNKKEANDFFIEYFKLLGEFNNFEEVKSELNNSNIFWLYDRVTYDTFGKELDKDIDLVVDSIPATCFVLRRINISNKCYINVGKIKNYLFDLQDFDSNYYPKEWLQNIKSKKLYLKTNNIQIPDFENHFMLGLYHMHIHKNKKQNNIRLERLKNMSIRLRYNGNIDIIILLNYLIKNKYKIIKPLDNNVNFFIEFKIDGGSYKNVIKYNNRYMYIYNDNDIYIKEKEIYKILEKYDIVPKILYYNDSNLLIEIENKGKILNHLNDYELLNITNFKEQINNITHIFNKHNIKHNDITSRNILISNNRLYIIDFEHSLYKHFKYIKRTDFNNYCNDLPKIKNEKTFLKYINNNKCLQ